MFQPSPLGKVSGIDVAFYNLEAGTDYDVYCSAEVNGDAFSQAEITATLQEVQTAAAQDPPVMTLTAFMQDFSLQPAHLLVTVTTDIASNVYCVVQADGARGPIRTEISTANAGLGANRSEA